MKVNTNGQIHKTKVLASVVIIACCIILFVGCGKEKALDEGYDFVQFIDGDSIVKRPTDNIESLNNIIGRANYAVDAEGVLYRLNIEKKENGDVLKPINPTKMASGFSNIKEMSLNKYLWYIFTEDGNLYSQTGVTEYSDHNISRGYYHVSQNGKRMNDVRVGEIPIEYVETPLLTNVKEIYVTSNMNGVIAALTNDESLYIWTQELTNENYDKDAEYKPDGAPRLLYKNVKTFLVKKNDSKVEYDYALLREDGDLYCWGAPGGKIGDEYYDDISRPKLRLINVESITWANGGSIQARVEGKSILLNEKTYPDIELSATKNTENTSNESSWTTRNSKDVKKETKDEYIFSDSNMRFLSSDEVLDLSVEEMGYARNEIFARNGYVFKTDKYNHYFTSKSWYHADSSFDGSCLNKYEDANIKLIKSIEEGL